MASGAHEVADFVRRYSKCMKADDAALFVGAGLSAGAGYVDWRELLREVATSIGLDVDKETDLVAVAQYHVTSTGSRATLNRHIMEAFAERAELTDNHRIIARWPLRTVWTTNYDDLLERSFQDAGKLCQPITTAGAISSSGSKRGVALYKMHGDIKNPESAVITKNDYETYRVEREEFLTVLASHLLTKTFLFVGFSFADPNLDYLLGWIREKRRENPTEHFWITKEVERHGEGPEAEAEFAYARRKQQLRVADMGRYGIKAILVDSYNDITRVLEQVGDVFRQNTVFVSGSAHDFGPLGHERLDSLVRGLAAALVKNSFKIVTGFGLGIGGAVLLGAADALYLDPKARLEERVLLRPFGPGSDGRRTLDGSRQRRRELVEQAGFAIFVAGNRLDGDRISRAAGVMEEFDLATEHGVLPIPIGATGHAAAELWGRVISHPERYFGRAVTGDLIADLRILGDHEQDNASIIDAVLRLLVQLSSDKDP